MGCRRHSNPAETPSRSGRFRHRSLRHAHACNPAGPSTRGSSDEHLTSRWAARRALQSLENPLRRQTARMRPQPHRTAALRTPPARDAEHPVQERRPRLVVRARRDASSRESGLVLLRHRLRWLWDHFRAPRMPPCQDPMVQHQMRARLGHQRRQTLHQLLGRERQARRPVRPRRLQLQQHSPVRQLRQSRTRQRGTRQVPAQPLPALRVSAPYRRTRVDGVAITGRTPGRKTVRPTSENLVPACASTPDGRREPSSTFRSAPSRLREPRR